MAIILKQLPSTVAVRAQDNLKTPEKLNVQVSKLEINQVRLRSIKGTLTKVLITGCDRHKNR